VVLVVRALGVALALAVATLAAGCSTLLGAEPTPVPGAAATITRSSRTPIPTPVRTPGASPAASPVASRVAVAASPSPAAAGASRPVSDTEIAQVQRQLQQAVANPDLPDIEQLLLDHVSLSTPDGGQVLDRADTASWLRDHAASGIKVTRVDRSTQTVTLEVLTEGWPIKAPLEQGQVSFSLRRYDASGRLDEDNGDWKVDVITAT
jgi:hypothetical protein